MIKNLFPIIPAALVAGAGLLSQSATAAALESAANQPMHKADFESLVAHFEDPARAEWQKPEEVIASLGRLEGKTVADIGAGTGYFAFPIATKAAKVVAIDIDQRFLDYIKKKKQSQKIGGNIETRLTTPDRPSLRPGEADLVLIVDTYHHFEERLDYLRKLKQGLRPDGELVIVDFKKLKAPPGPPVALRLAQGQVEKELKAAGFTIVSADRDMLPYQYVIKAC